MNGVDGVFWRLLNTSLVPLCNALCNEVFAGKAKQRAGFCFECANRIFFPPPSGIYSPSSFPFSWSVVGQQILYNKDFLAFAELRRMLCMV